MKTLRQVWAELTPARRQAIRAQLLGDAAADGEADFAGIRIVFDHAQNPSIKAPCCGRATPMDGLLDVRPIALATRSAYLAQAGIRNPAAKFLCTLCLNRLERTGTVTKWRIAQALGASATLVAKLKAGAGE